MYGLRLVILGAAFTIYRVNIPSHVKIKNKCVYEILIIDKFPDEDKLGECRFYSRQIVIAKNQTKRQMIKTFIHEVSHAISYERKIKISHEAVYQLEDAILYFVTRNKLD